ncbi:hypothetical protein V8E36_008103 [Tilletia maclaganii]
MPQHHRPVSPANPHSDVQHQLPSLGYSMTARRKRTLCTSVLVLILTNLVLPCIIYYILRQTQGNRMKAIDLYGLTSIPMGVLQVPQWPYRFYLIARDRGQRSAVPTSTLSARTITITIATASTQAEEVVNAKISPRNNIFSSSLLGVIRSSPSRTHLRTWLSYADTFQWCFLLGIIVGSIPLILASSVEAPHGSFEALMLTYPIILAFVGSIMLIVTLLSLSSAQRSWFRMSSVPKRSRYRPALAYLWEDLTAVDGGGGHAFRQAFTRRYEASPHFRSTLTTTSLFLALSFLLYAGLGTILTIILAQLDRHHRQRSDEEPGRERRPYEPWSLATNMVLFALWHGITALVATKWTRRKMREEERRWNYDCSSASEGAITAHIATLHRPPASPLSPLSQDASEFDETIQIGPFSQCADAFGGEQVGDDAFHSTRTRLGPLTSSRAPTFRSS